LSLICRVYDICITLHARYHVTRRYQLAITPTYITVSNFETKYSIFRYRYAIFDWNVWQVNRISDTYRNNSTTCCDCRCRYRSDAYQSQFRQKKYTDSLVCNKTKQSRERDLLSSLLSLFFSSTFCSLFSTLFSFELIMMNIIHIK